MASIWGVRSFRRPLKILNCYIHRTCPPDRLVELRNGYRIHLTGDVDDVVTLLVVIGRNDYGEIPRGGVVIDIGAHLGAFTLCALMRGAARVYSYEPDPALQSILVRNVRENGLEERVQANEAAVVGSGNGRVTFYQEDNASGSLDPHDGQTGCISVRSVTLSQVVLDNRIAHVDMLKLDCEGSEYGILSATPKEVWDRIGRVALEYHKGQADRIVSRFRDLGFRLTRFRPHDDQVGVMWFER